MYAPKLIGMMGKQDDSNSPAADRKDEAATLKAWLPQLSLDYIQTRGWTEVNRRQNASTISARTFANTHYAAPEEEELRGAFFSGVTFALLAQLHISDIQELRAHLLPDSARHVMRGRYVLARQVIQPKNASAPTIDVVHDADEAALPEA
jgi:hypothetical protein